MSKAFESPAARRLAREAAEEDRRGNVIAARTMRQHAQEEEKAYPGAVKQQVREIVRSQRG